MRFFTLCIGILLLWGCKKQDHQFPELSSHWEIPVQNLYQYQDTLYIQSHGASNDDFGLTQIQFTVQDLNAKVWIQKSITFAQGTSQWDGKVALALSDRYMPSGEYYIQVILSDGAHETKVILSFTYIECAIARTHLLLASGSNLENWYPNNAPTLWNLSNDILPVLSDPFHQLIWGHHSTDPVVQAYAPMAGVPEWTAQTASLSGVAQMILDTQNQGCWILSQDGSIELLNEKGIRLKNVIENNTQSIALDNQRPYILLNQNSPGAPGRLVIKNKQTWGNLHTWVHGKNAIDAFVWENYAIIVYLENGTYQMGLLNLDNFLTLNWHPLLNISWSTPPLHLEDNGILWIAGDNQILGYDIQGTIAAGPFAFSPSQWSVSKFDHGFWMIQNGTALQVNPANGQIIWSSPQGNYNMVLEMTNK